MERLAHLWLRHRTAFWAVSGTVAGLAIAGGTWWHHLNVSPSYPNPPANPIVHPNAYDYVAQAASLYVSEKGRAQVYEHPGKPIAPLDARAALLKANVPAIETLREGFRYPYQVPPMQNTSDVFERTSDNSYLRHMANLLRFAGHVAEDQGRYGKAAHYYLDAIQLGMDIPRGDGLIRLIVGVAAESTGRSRMWKLTDKLSASEAREAAIRLESLCSKRMPLADMIVQEKRNDELFLREDFAKKSTFGMVHSGNFKAASGEKKPTLLDYMRADSRLLFQSKQQIFESVDTGFDTFIQRAQEPAYSPQRDYGQINSDPISEYLLQPERFAGAEIIDRNARMSNALLLIKLALRAYQLEYHNYPLDLTMLVKGGYLSQIPTDPFSTTATPFHYELSSAHQYILYSVGPDGVDDQGKAILRKERKQIGKPSPFAAPGDTGDFVIGKNVP